MEQNNVNSMKCESVELVMFVGVPASGKSTLSKYYTEKGYYVLSSDEIRFSMMGELLKYPDKQQELNQLNRRVFENIDNDTKRFLENGESVVVDATNLSRTRRKKFLKKLQGVSCYKRCIVFITPIDVCISRNMKRQGIARVPDNAMERMFRQFECPYYWEGWDEIECFTTSDTYKFPFEKTVDFAQDNPHHSLSLSEHLIATKNFAVNNGYSVELQEVAYYHDIGKLYTKEFKNAQGDPTEHAHYYGHENYGAYLYLAEKCCGKNIEEDEFEIILYNANLINCHMRPLNYWNKYDGAKEKDIVLFGEGFVKDIGLLYDADRSAH